MAKRRTFRFRLYKNGALNPLWWSNTYQSEAKVYAAVRDLRDERRDEVLLNGVTGFRIEVKDAGSRHWVHYETLPMEG